MILPLLSVGALAASTHAEVQRPVAPASLSLPARGIAARRNRRRPQRLFQPRAGDAIHARRWQQLYRSLAWRHRAGAGAGRRDRRRLRADPVGLLGHQGARPGGRRLGLLSAGRAGPRPRDAGALLQRGRDVNGSETCARIHYGYDKIEEIQTLASDVERAIGVHPRRFFGQANAERLSVDDQRALNSDTPDFSDVRAAVPLITEDDPGRRGSMRTIPSPGDTGGPRLRVVEWNAAGKIVRDEGASKPAVPVRLDPPRDDAPEQGTSSRLAFIRWGAWLGIIAFAVYKLRRSMKRRTQSRAEAAGPWSPSVPGVEPPAPAVDGAVPEEARELVRSRRSPISKPLIVALHRFGKEVQRIAKASFDADIAAEVGAIIEQHFDHAVARYRSAAALGGNEADRADALLTPPSNAWRIACKAGDQQHQRDLSGVDEAARLSTRATPIRATACPGARWVPRGAAFLAHPQHEAVGGVVALRRGCRWCWSSAGLRKHVAGGVQLEAGGGEFLPGERLVHPVSRRGRAAPAPGARYGPRLVDAALLEVGVDRRLFSARDVAPSGRCGSRGSSRRPDQVGRLGQLDAEIVRHVTICDVGCAAASRFDRVEPVRPRRLRRADQRRAPCLSARPPWRGCACNSRRPAPVRRPSCPVARRRRRPSRRGLRLASRSRSAAGRPASATAAAMPAGTGVRRGDGGGGEQAGEGGGSHRADHIVSSRKVSEDLRFASATAPARGSRCSAMRSRSARSRVMLAMMRIRIRGWLVAQRVHLLDAEAIGAHRLVGDDVGGAAAALDQRHLAAAHPRPDRAEPDRAAAARRPRRGGCWPALGDGEEQGRLLAFARQRLAGGEGERDRERLDLAPPPRRAAPRRCRGRRRRRRAGRHRRRAASIS